jgi:TolB-like protein
VIYQFEDHVIDTTRRELRRGAMLVPVEPQVFDLIEFLIQNRGRVVSKDDLINAIWNGRAISESALSNRVNAARSAINDTGKDQRLIRTLPRKGIRFVGSVRQQETHAAESPLEYRAEPQRFEPPLPDRPSIAVLPFQNMSGDPEQEYFADGVVEDVIGALSRMRRLFVIARNSSFTYKGRAVDVKQVGRELGVRYVLEGSVRKAANRVRLTGQLIDAATGVHISSDRFDGDVKDIFDLQDQMTARVVGAILPKLEQAEIERARCKPTEHLDAYDYYLRAMASFYQRNREANQEALRLFNRAIDLDPDFAAAYGMAAWCYAWRKMNGWVTDETQQSIEAARLARRAVELGKDDAIALARGGHALAFVAGDLDSGVVFLDRALVLNANLAPAWTLSGWLRAYRGEPDVAIEHHANAMRLSPLDPIIYHMQVGTAFAHMLAGRYNEALSWAEPPFRAEPEYLPAAGILAAARALAGRVQEARQAMQHLRRIDPALRISNLRQRHPIRRAEDLAKFAEGLRKAGLPE